MADLSEESRKFIMDKMKSLGGKERKETTLGDDARQDIRRFDFTALVDLLTDKTDPSIMSRVDITIRCDACSEGILLGDAFAKIKLDNGVTFLVHASGNYPCLTIVHDHEVDE